jgi:hypothetical protein
MDLPIVHTCESLCVDSVGALGRVYIFRHNRCCRRVDILIDQFDGKGIWVGSIDILYLVSKLPVLVKCC